MSDPANLVLTDGYPTVRASQVRVKTLAGPQFQHLSGLVECPDARKGRIEVPNQCPRTPAEHRRQFVALDDRLPNVGRERRQELSFGTLVLDLLASRNISEHDDGAFDVAVPT